MAETLKQVATVGAFNACFSCGEEEERKNAGSIYAKLGSYFVIFVDDVAGQAGTSPPPR